MLTAELRHLPVLVWRLQGSWTADDSARYVREQDAVIARGQPFVVLFDAAGMKGIDAKELRVIAGYLKDHENEMKRLNLVSALILTSAVARGALKALVWLQPMPSPFVVCADVPQALAVLEEHAKKAGLRLPASLAELRKTSAS